jgi:exonuclease VII small subunit
MPVNNGKPESDAIKRARQDINDRAAELERAQQVAAAAGVKLQAAQDALAKLLEKQANAKN